MAIKLKDEKGFIYLALQEKIFTSDEKDRADKIYEDCRDAINAINNNNNLINIWLKRGCVAKEMHVKYSILPNEELYFWEMLYDVANIKLPVRSKKLLARNEFWLGAKLNDYLPISSKWKTNWTVFREMFEASAISQDNRVAEWMIRFAIRNDFKSRDDMRVLLNKVRNRLKNINTAVLSRKELFLKLDDINTPVIKKKG